jgi:hypothetical protein
LLLVAALALLLALLCCFSSVTAMRCRSPMAGWHAARLSPNSDSDQTGEPFPIQL